MKRNFTAIPKSNDKKALHEKLTIHEIKKTIALPC